MPEPPLPPPPPDPDRAARVALRVLAAVFLAALVVGGVLVVLTR
ncbi:hypothetical protein [Streptomyces gilvosporeus]|nr:hypothetical protein [Streptomyces gilvosporeus]